MRNATILPGNGDIPKSGFPDGPSNPVPWTEADIAHLGSKEDIELALRGIVRRLGRELRTDDLTGALNAAAFREAVSKNREEHPDSKRGLIFVDLGNFKKANGKNGSTQAIGDGVLMSVADLFNRPGDLVGRLGGDEFALFVDLEPRKEPRPPQEVLAEEVERIASQRDRIINERGYGFLDEGPVRFFIAAGGIQYNDEAGYEANLQAANTVMGVNKEIGYETYGQYRIAEDAA